MGENEFELNGGVYEAAPEPSSEFCSCDTCCGCAFNPCLADGHVGIPECRAHKRLDCRGVIFVEKNP